MSKPCHWHPVVVRGWFGRRKVKLVWCYAADVPHGAPVESPLRGALMKVLHDSRHEEATG